MTWSEIYSIEIIKKGGLLPFILNKEKRSAGALIGRIKNTLPQGARILEVGTGTGAIGALLTKYGFDVVGIDIDPRMTQIAQQSFALFGEFNKVFTMDAKDIVSRFGKNSFNCVITHGMLEHYKDSEIISHLKRQLEVASLAVCIVPMKAMSLRYRSRGLGDERYLSSSYWKTLLKRNFRVKNIFGFGFKETNRPYLSEKIIRVDTLAKIFAPLCAFNEFWIIRSE
jgi:SAM-dependent methyltransferase